MPRSNDASGRTSRDSSRDERPQRSSAPRSPRRNIDEEVVVLREKGGSYASVAQALGIKRATEAHAAFLRALKSRPAEERVEMTARESQRLDRLETRIRERDADDQVKMDRRLVALERLRECLR